MTRCTRQHPAATTHARSIALAIVAAFAAPAALAAPAPPAPAPQATPPEPAWVPLTAGVPAGTEAEIYTLAGSSATETFVEVVIHGFWEEQVTAPDGSAYQRIRVPGLPSFGQVGAPELPVARFALGVPTDADDVSLLGHDVMSETTFGGRRIYPTPIPASDEEFDPSEDPGPGDTEGSDEVFMQDDVIYGMATPWPGTPAAGPAPVEALFGHVPVALCETHPVQYEPADKRLTVAARTLYHFTHAGPVGAFAPATKKKLAAAEKLVLNWPSVKFAFPLGADSYHSRYLIVTRGSYVPALSLFELHKKLLGYDTEIRVPASLDFVGVHATISDWYAEGSGGMDHFVLLVGDVDTIPLFDMRFVGLTDDLYASIGGDFFKEIHLGRLSVDSTDDLANQVQKIIDYERNPVPAGPYDRAVLVAHDQDAPYKYTLAHTIVAGQSYATPPAFDLQFGYYGATDASVIASIDAGAGLVAYRGHGSTNAWTDWNPDADDFHKNDVLALDNGDTIKPIVWSIACTNNNIDHGGGTIDCFGEVWLEAEGAGGVAHYGATGTTGTEFNHVLDRRLFRTVFDDGVTTHGIALDATELMLWIDGWQGKETWRYMLLGDPSMRIRREPAPGLGFHIPAPPPSSDGSGETTDLDFAAVTPSGAPISGALVAIFKASLVPGEADEVLTNAYTDDFGAAHFVVELPTPGELHYSLQSEQGHVAVGSMQVGMSPAWSSLPGGAPGVHGTPTLTGLGTLVGGKPLRLVVTNARESSSAWLVLGFEAIDAPFKGGILVPDTDLVVGGLPTSADGHFVIDAIWPAGAPSGFAFYTQCWISDPAAPVGLAGTNGLKGVTP